MSRKPKANAITEFINRVLDSDEDMKRIKGEPTDLDFHLSSRAVLVELRKLAEEQADG